MKHAPPTLQLHPHAPRCNTINRPTPDPAIPEYLPALLILPALPPRSLRSLSLFRKVTAEKIRELYALKEQAVQREDFDEAKRLKARARGVYLSSLACLCCDR